MKSSLRASEYTRHIHHKSLSFMYQVDGLETDS
jgi:hypothetical protein